MADHTAVDFVVQARFLVFEGVLKAARPAACAAARDT